MVMIKDNSGKQKLESQNRKLELASTKMRSCYDRSSIQLPRLMTYMPHTILRLGMGGGFFGVITEHRKVFMWGYIDWSAPFSDGRLFSPMHKQVEAISCGAWHMTMLTTDGKVYTLGHGGYGQLGYDWCEDHGYWKVHKASSTERCTAIVAGSVSTMFVTESGELWACGLNHPQFGRLGVGSEEPMFKEPVRIKIPEPLSEVSASYTLYNLRNVYGARSKDGLKVYAWGWGFESMIPQIYEGASSIHDVFHYIATPSTIEDHFVFSKLGENDKLNASTQPAETEKSIDTHNNETVKPFQRLRRKVGLQLILPTSRVSNNVTLTGPKIKDYQLKNNSVTTNGLSSSTHHVGKVNFPVTKLNKTLPAIREGTAHKSYLDYLYSEGTKKLEFGELMEIYLPAVHYEETQLIDHTFNRIKNEVNEQNLVVLLELSQINQLDSLKKISQTFIRNLCEEPQKVVDLIMSLTINHKRINKATSHSSD